ncbi:family 1 glycoside hydrolase [Opitutaceae bacterium TAV5]|nr:family 1 glycoside hydrolase [Opitutaceae bacterium TAV5]
MSTSRANKIVRAWLESPTHGIIELAHDWRARHVPPLLLGDGERFTTLTRVPDYTFGIDHAYMLNRKGDIVFFIPQDARPLPRGDTLPPIPGTARLRDDRDSPPPADTVYLAGDFNHWNPVGQAEWELHPATFEGFPLLVWSGPAERFFAAPGQPLVRFKFVTAAGRWFDVPATAPNALRDDLGNYNRTVDPERTGWHLFRFTVPAPLDLAQSWSVQWQGDGSVPLMPGPFFYNLHTTLPLGAIVREEETTFRIFAPRAHSVELHICENLERQDACHDYVLKRRPDSHGDAGVWEVVLTGNLHGWYYWYTIDGPRDAFGLFNPAHRILDPWALATVGPLGPAIVIDRSWLGRGERIRDYMTPDWQDLVIAEAHVRDLAARAPLSLSPDERRGFTGLRRWVESPDFYLHRLGVNCVELQPVQEADNKTPAEYHWGYMTNNFFAPTSSYALDPARASGLKEFQELVAAFHRRGIAVILDVVYNHVGEPAHLMFIDRLYYFEQDASGKLANWSGCGNDLRAGSAMATRLIIESCTHLVEAFGVDGFRFDLADLIGVPVLGQVERALKRVKPDIILIAEPWSFRGHIAGALRDTGWASWNDGYRNFLREYVRGGSNSETFEYFLKGSPWYYAKWPAQTVNYVESHDDRTWIDAITENYNGSGDHPTAADRARTHLMAAVLFMSIGIPMLSAGQDFIRSKQGINNTYQMGDINALDYRRIYRFPTTHTYFADWIAFRRSETGRLLRHFSRASEGFFRFIRDEHSTAAAVIYNADCSRGATQLLFAINPLDRDVTLRLGDDVATPDWKQLADQEHFFRPTMRRTARRLEPDLYLPPLGCGLWMRES